MDLKYRAENFSRAHAYSSSSDTVEGSYFNCRRCYKSFKAGELRLSARIQSFKRDAKDELWYHFGCFFKQQRPRSIAEIENFENLTVADQKSIRDKMKMFEQPLLPSQSVNMEIDDDPVPQPSTSTAKSTSSSKSTKKKSRKRPAPKDDAKLPQVENLDDYTVEYSKSGRSECVGCRNKIMKGLLRVGKLEYFTEVGMRFNGQAFQHHLECFGVMCRKEYKFYLSGDKLPGFRDLKVKDQQKVLKHVTEGWENVNDAKKPKLADDNETMPELEELIESQSHKLHTVRSLVTSSNHAQLAEFLKLNNSKVPTGFENILDRCADFITFGAIEKCKTCVNGDLMFAKHGYKCNGKLNEWSRCSKESETPSRVPVKFPSSMESIQSELLAQNGELDVKNRAVRPKPQVVDPKREVKVVRAREPLYNMHVVFIGRLGKPEKAALKLRIESMGGKLVTKLQERIAVVISTMDEVDKMSKRMKLVKEFHIQVVDESFLDAIEGLSPAETVDVIQDEEISDWGSDPLTRIPQEEFTTEMRESIYARFAKKKVDVKVRNGSAVDPDSKMQDEAHVYEREGLLFNSVLALVDITKNKNSYHKLQVLQSNDRRKFWLFQSYGRTGTTVGDSKLEQFSSAELAVTEFERIYKSKTNNRFDPSAEFKKKLGFFYPIEIDYQDDTAKFNLNEKSEFPSNLPEATQRLMKMIFDIDNMRQTMMEFELDLTRMPLGKLSKKQLLEAQQTLAKLNELIVEGADASQFVGYSNKFFTLVPHSMGMRQAPVIDTLELIKAKQEMIESLLQIEIAYSLLQDEVDENVNPIDARYEQMSTKLQPLEHESKEFKLIQSYVDNTHAPTHSDYQLIVEDVFKVKRDGEKERYRPFKSLHNRQLLWHGSRTTNFASILKNGLKIAPPEAPATGYMFGKGIYFADIVSKSSNYCFASAANPAGLMVLSEVALGDTMDLTKAQFIKRLSSDYHSVRGLGKTYPEPSMAQTTKDGVVIPLGKPVTSDKIKSELLYNEYIVYDHAQVNIKYLLKMKFAFKKK